MLELWQDDMIRFMRHASEYGAYNQTLAETIAPHLTPDMRICDAGSGLGYLSLALSPFVGHITAVEKNPAAAVVLEQNCRDLGIRNITSRCAGIEDAIPDKKYDAMVFCFFGQIRQILEIGKTQCAGDIFLFTRNYRNHRFSAGSLPTGWEGYPDARAALTQLGIPREEQTLSVEFGQPLTSMEDARQFFRLYSKDPDTAALTDDFIRSRVIPTGREDFPLYAPHQRPLALVRFSVRDIP